VAREKEPEAEQRATDRRDELRSAAILDESGDDEPCRKEHDADRRHPRGLRTRPAEFLFERQEKHAHAVEGAERHVQHHAADDGQPAIHLGSSPDAAGAGSVTVYQRFGSPKLRIRSPPRRPRSPPPDATATNSSPFVM